MTQAVRMAGFIIGKGDADCTDPLQIHLQRSRERQIPIRCSDNYFIRLSELSGEIK
jgi:hypothetical protein